MFVEGRPKELDPMQGNGLPHLQAPLVHQAVSSPPVVHLELHTHDLEAASAFYSELLQWRTECIDTRWGTYSGMRRSMRSTCSTTPRYLSGSGYPIARDILSPHTHAERWRPHQPRAPIDTCSYNQKQAEVPAAPPPYFSATFSPTAAAPPEIADTRSVSRP
jgi:bleomycin resistance family protein